MTTLVYHDPATAPGSISVFDRTVMELAENNAVWIACPYLNLAILQRILERSGKEWKLLTDVEELLRSQTAGGRRQFAAFLKENQVAVHHVTRLHAKVIIAGESAVVGSANFTKSGMTQRTEMAVVLTGREAVEELRRWFEAIWERSSEVEANALDMLVTALPADLRLREDAPNLLTPSGVVVQTTLAPVMKPRLGRWSEAAFIGRVIERCPELLDLHNSLRERLKSVGGLQFRGDGPTIATYNVVVPGTDSDVAWIYESGKVYIRWGKLRVFGDDVVSKYQDMWADLIDVTTPDGTEKIDGCNLSGALTHDTISLIESNLLKVSELVAAR